LTQVNAKIPVRILQNALMFQPVPSEMSVGDTATTGVTEADRLSDQDGVDSDDSDFTDTEDINDDAEDQFPMELDDNDVDTLVDDLEMNLRRNNAGARSVLETDEPFIAVDDTGDQSNISTLEALSISEDDVLFPPETTSWELSESSFLSISHQATKRMTFHLSKAMMVPIWRMRSRK
jgi:hypothetical protein